MARCQLLQCAGIDLWRITKIAGLAVADEAVVRGKSRSNDGVCGARTIRERATALALLRRAVQGDESRLHQEDRAAVITVADEELEFLRGRKLGQAALRAQLGIATIAMGVAMADVSDERFANFKPTPEDLLVLERKIRHGAKGRWLAAFLAHRTGAWDQHILEPLIAEKRAESLKNTLGHTPAVRAMSKRRAVRKSSSP